MDECTAPHPGAMLSPMPPAMPQRTACEMRSRLLELRAEHGLLVADTAVTELELRELELDIAGAEHLFVGLAVTEIASLRADVDGQLHG